MKPKIVIIGAGGHGKVVCDAIIAQNKYEVAGFVDLSISVGEVVANNFKVVASQKDISILRKFADYFVVAIGNNSIREKIFEEAKLVLEPSVIIHPTAVIGSDVSIAEGCVVLANTVINVSSLVEHNTIVNVGTVIDHDCKIGANVHLSIGTMVGSNSHISSSFTSEIGQKINSFSKINLV
ncbi:MAG: hypothetical protein A3F72_07265 [Bacteroidetes bacterium RIFCSPLOWO2_12_FULL_35_15]|nr:MAG: hypothetical protein A3F72_07265 [Bacteroidetes bacterium RIFCSPLOWO2_12_FULL_35_15]